MMFLKTIDAICLAEASSAAAAWSYASICVLTIIINIVIIPSYNYNILSQNMKFVFAYLVLFNHVMDLLLVGSSQLVVV